MGKIFAELDDDLRAFIARQHVDFVATAPSAGGHVNVSPKGQDTFRILGPTTVAYLDRGEAGPTRCWEPRSTSSAPWPCSRRSRRSVTK